VQPIAQLKKIAILYIAIRHKTKQKYKMTTENDFKNALDLRTALVLIDTAINAASSATSWLEEDFDFSPDEKLLGSIKDGSAEMDLVKAIDSLYAAKDKITEILQTK